MCGIVLSGLQDCKFTKLKIFKQDLITAAFGGIHMNFITTKYNKPKFIIESRNDLTFYVCHVIMFKC